MLYNIYNDLVEAVKPIVGGKCVFLNDRPKFHEGTAPMEKFIVVDLPVSIGDYVTGSETYLTTSGIFYLFAQSRSNETLDVNVMGRMVDDVLSLFPVSGLFVVASNPVLRMTGSDGHGFQVATVTFDIHSR
jgi:hypothetical protein